MTFELYLRHPKGNGSLETIEYEIDPVDVCSKIAEGFMDEYSDNLEDENYFDPTGCEIAAFRHGDRRPIARCSIKRKKPRGQECACAQSQQRGKDSYVDVALRWWRQGI